MPSIPLYQFTPGATPQSAERAPSDLYAPVAAGGRALGAGIASLGEPIAAFALKKQEAVNYGMLADAERQMKEGFMLFQDELARNGDEKTWTALWQKKVGEIEANLKMGDMPPAVRDRLSPALKDWQMMTTAQVQQQATAREIDRSKANVMAAAELDLKQGDVEAYVSKIRGGEARGLFDPREAEQLVGAGETNAEYYQATNLILTDPIAAMDALTEKNDGGKWANFGKLDEPRRKTLVDSANVAMQRSRAETYQGLIDRMNGGELIGDKELDELVARKLFTPTQARDVKRNQAKGGGLASGQAGKFAEVLVAINGYDPKADGTMERYADLAVSVATLPPGLKEDAYAQLKEKRDPASPLNSQVARDSMEQVSQAFNAGLYGAWKQRVVGASGQWEEKTDPKAYAAAMEKRVKIEDNLTRFFRENPKATRADAFKFVSDLNADDVAKQGMALFTAPDVSRAASIPTPDELDAILSRAGYAPRK